MHWMVVIAAVSVTCQTLVHGSWGPHEPVIASGREREQTDETREGTGERGPTRACDQRRVAEMHRVRGAVMHNDAGRCGLEGIQRPEDHRLCLAGYGQAAVGADARDRAMRRVAHHGEPCAVEEWPCHRSRVLARAQDTRLREGNAHDRSRVTPVNGDARVRRRRPEPHGAVLRPRGHKPTAYGEAEDRSLVVAEHSLLGT